jgi:hypothetical protein
MLIERLDLQKTINAVKDKNRLTEDKEINLYLYNIHRGLTVRKLKYIREHK